jgi:hypothetical protein
VGIAMGVTTLSRATVTANHHHESHVRFDAVK